MNVVKYKQFVNGLWTNKNLQNLLQNLLQKIDPNTGRKNIKTEKESNLVRYEKTFHWQFKTTDR